MSKKVFISQPMSGRTDREVFDERARIIEAVDEYEGDFVEIVDSFNPQIARGRTPLWLLGRDIQLLAQADFAVFMEGYEFARGCTIEKKVCDEYHIPFVFAVENEDGKLTITDTYNRK